MLYVLRMDAGYDFHFIRVDDGTKEVTVHSRKMEDNYHKLEVKSIKLIPEGGFDLSLDFIAHTGLSLVPFPIETVLPITTVEEGGKEFYIPESEKYDRNPHPRFRLSIIPFDNLTETALNDKHGIDFLLHASCFFYYEATEEERAKLMSFISRSGVYDYLFFYARFAFGENPNEKELYRTYCALFPEIGEETRREWFERYRRAYLVSARTIAGDAYSIHYQDHCFPWIGRSYSFRPVTRLCNGLGQEGDWEEVHKRIVDIVDFTKRMRKDHAYDRYVLFDAFKKGLFLHFTDDEVRYISMGAIAEERGISEYEFTVEEVQTYYTYDYDEHEEIEYTRTYDVFSAKKAREYFVDLAAKGDEEASLIESLLKEREG